MHPIGSRIIGITISVVVILMIDHSRIMEFMCIDKYRLVLNIEIDIIQRRRLHRIEMLRLYIMVKSIYYTCLKSQFNILN